MSSLDSAGAVRRTMADFVNGSNTSSAVVDVEDATPANPSSEQARSAVVATPSEERGGEATPSPHMPRFPILGGGRAVPAPQPPPAGEEEASRDDAVPSSSQEEGEGSTQ
eukprot:37002-Rhodomonas_salina.1